jgi:hypothetical protein
MNRPATKKEIAQIFKASKKASNILVQKKLQREKIRDMEQQKDLKNSP